MARLPIRVHVVFLGTGVAVTFPLWLNKVRLRWFLQHLDYALKLLAASCCFFQHIFTIQNEELFKSKVNIDILVPLIAPGALAAAKQRLI